MILRLIQLVCAAVLCVILILGLWPFHSPRNDVSWLVNRNGLYFGKYATVFSSSARPAMRAGNPASASLEIWLQPGRIWDFSTFLTFYVSGSPVQFSLRQAQTSLLLQAARPDDPHHPGIESLYVEHAFRETGPSFITVTSGAQGTAVYIDGVKAATAPEMRLSTPAFAGRLVLGDSAQQPDSWTGKLLGLAIYNRQMDSTQVLEHFANWTRQGRPQMPGDVGNIALYTFDERAGRVIRSKSGPGFDLYVPEKYTVLGHLFLESPWSEFKRSDDYWGAIVKNIIGFIPLGCSFYAYFCLARQTRRPALLTLVLGFGVSFTIELLQWFLPTRSSGATDLFTNTLGTWIGIVLYQTTGLKLLTRLHAMPRGAGRPGRARM